MPRGSSAKPLPSPRSGRVELYRLLSDEGRLQLLALCAEEELSIGELGALVNDSQPQVSRRVAPLRQAGLLEARKDGTRTWLKTTLLDGDPVLADALEEGRRLCHADGSLARIPKIVAAREESGRAFFEEATPQAISTEGELFPLAHLAHLAALAPLLPGRSLAVDVGTGEGALLDVLVPLFERVIAVDRSRARLARCAARVAQRGYAHVSLFPGSYDDADLIQRVDAAGGADLVFASRTLHHASRPAQAISSFARLLKKGGHLLVLEYLPHDDESMRSSQGDVWLGFSPRELFSQLAAAGLERVGEVVLPPAFFRGGPDAHLSWHAAVARRPFERPRPSLVTP
ncbi:MAG: ArsR/SmtB family transcription factor [Myxococcota bacterium]